MLAFVMCRCSGDWGESGNEIFKPNSAGRFAEVVVVMEKKLWEKPSGKAIYEILNEEMIGVPQPEEMFHVIRITPKNFKSMFKAHRTVLLTEISSKFTEPKIVFENDKWAKAQYIMKITAPNDSTFEKLVRDNKKLITNKLIEADMKRTNAFYRKNEAPAIRAKLEKNYHISMVAPNGYKIFMEEENFIWIGTEKPKTTEAFFVYFYDYVDSNTFEKESLIRMRDSFLKQYVAQDEFKKNYMYTDSMYSTGFEEFMLNGEYATKLRGIWLVNNDFMGGPFVSISMVDKKRNRIVTVDGYVYAGKQEKRDYIRRVEAILHTLKIL